MRRLVTIAAAALTLGSLSFAAPAFAHQNAYGGEGSYNRPAPYQNNNYDNDKPYQGQFDRDRNFNRQEGNFDRWERGWKPGFAGPTFGYHQPLSYRQLVRRLEYQGYYGVRGLRASHFGGWRAFAFAGRGQPVMLRINPYTGRVFDVRYI